MANSATALHACCLSGPAAIRSPEIFPRKGVCRTDILSYSHDFYQKTECYGNSCQYDIHQCALLHVEPPFFMAFFPKASYRPPASRMPSRIHCHGLLQALPLCTAYPYEHTKPQRQRLFQPSIQIMIQYSSVMEKFFIIAMKPGGFPGFLSADGHRCSIYPAAFLINSVKTGCLLHCCILHRRQTTGKT